VLAAAVETFETVGALEQTQVPFPIKVFVYRTADEMQPAIAPNGGGPGVRILGEVVYSDTAMVSVDTGAIDITRHEVAHIVTGEATKGPFGIPGWMNEGISVYAQENPLPGHQQALDAAIRGDRTLTMAQLNSPSSGGAAGTVGLYYGQSGSIITYLVETYGEAQFAELLRVFKEGSTPDDAFEGVYGFDQAGLENEWRESVGLPPRGDTPEPTAEVVRPDPTEAPDDDAPAGSADSNDGGGGSDIVPIVVIVGLVALVAATAAGTFVVVRRRM
jgi:hypothetical protein